MKYPPVHWQDNTYHLLIAASAHAVAKSFYVSHFDIETVSDVLSLLFKLDEQVDMRFEAEKDENGEFIPSTIKLSFQNAAINQKLCTYLKAKQIKENLENSKEKLSAKDDYTEAISEIEQNIEDIKNHLVDDNMVVKKGTDGITVKLFPQ